MYTLVIGISTGLLSHPAAQPHGAAPIVVFDNDADFDDTVALAALAQQHIRGAIAATQPEVVDFTRDRITVIQDGVSSGRTIEDPNGSLLWVAFTANTALFEDTLIQVLNGNR